MRIAIITENFLPKVDGVTRTLARLLEHLSNTQHQVLLLGPETNMKSYAGAEIVGTFGIPFFFYPELKFNFWRPLFSQKLKEFQPDIIHLVDPVFLGAFGLFMIPSHIPIVTSYHTNLAVYCHHFGMDFLTQTMWKWNRYCHSFSKYIACPSPSTQTMLLDHAFNENVRIWPRGVDISLFSPIARSNDIRAQWLNDVKGYSKSVILYVGRVSFEKNIDLVIRAYQSMDHTTCHLVIVGHGPALNELQTRCLKDDLPVTFTGYLQGKQLSEVYASADIFAFPSVTETFGQVVLEAMASGLPVVGLEAEGVVDLVTHKKTGLLLNTNGLNFDQQVVQYRHLLNRLIVEKETRLNMSKESMIKAKKYTWFEAMECMVNIYRDAIGQEQEQEQILIHEEQVDSGVEEDYFSDNKLSHL